MGRIGRIIVDQRVQGGNRRHRLHRQDDAKTKSRHALSGFLEEVAREQRPHRESEYVIDARAIAIFFWL
jgi:hypothetical protein